MYVQLVLGIPLVAFFFKAGTEMAGDWQYLSTYIGRVAIQPPVILFYL